MDLAIEKLNFIKNEIFALTIAGAFSRGYPIYHNGKLITDKQRDDLYSFIKIRLSKYEITYKNKISGTIHIKNIENLQTEVNKNYSNILNLSFGRTQKLLNLYLKYLWALNKIKEPCHCPFDAIIISKLRVKVPVWTNPKFKKEHYENLVNLVKIEASKSNLSIAEWELNYWNTEVL